MKKIIVIFFLCLSVACGREAAQSPENEIMADTASTDTTALMDGVSSATSKIDHISLNGTIEISPQARATVSIVMGGTVQGTTLLPGQYVHKGKVLGTFVNPDFINLQQNFLENHAQLEYLKTEYERQQKLSAEEAASQKKYQQSKADYLSVKSRCEAASVQLSLLGVDPDGLLTAGIVPVFAVKAPINGYVSNVQVNVGKYIAAGDVMCEIIDKNNVLLRLTLYEKDLEKIAENKLVQFKVNGLKDEIFDAELISVGKQVDPVNRSIEAYAKVINSDERFIPGMYVTARIKIK